MPGRSSQVGLSVMMLCALGVCATNSCAAPTVQEELQQRLQKYIAEQEAKRLAQPWPPPGCLPSARARLEKVEGLEKLVVQGWEQFYLARYVGSGSAYQLWSCDVVAEADRQLAAAGIPVGAVELIGRYGAFREAHPEIREHYWEGFVEQSPEFAKADPNLLMAVGKACHGLGVLSYRWGDFAQAEEWLSVSVASAYTYESGLWSPPGECHSFFDHMAPAEAHGRAKERREFLALLAGQGLCLVVSDGGDVPALRIYFGQRTPRIELLEQNQDDLLDLYRRMRDFYLGGLSQPEREAEEYKLRACNYVIAHSGTVLQKAREYFGDPRDGLGGSTRPHALWNSTFVGFDTPLRAEPSRVADLLGEMVHELWGHQIEAQRLVPGHDVVIGDVEGEGNAVNLEWHAALDSPSRVQHRVATTLQELTGRALLTYDEVQKSDFVKGRLGWTIKQLYDHAAAFNLFLEIRGNPTTGASGLRCRWEFAKFRVEHSGGGDAYTSVYGAPVDALWQECFGGRDWADRLYLAACGHFGWQP